MKLRVTVTSVYEFETENSCYPDDWDDEQIIECEREAFNNEPGMIFDMRDSKLSVSVDRLSD